MEEIGNYRTLASEWDEGNKKNGNGDGNKNSSAAASAASSEAPSRTSTAEPSRSESNSNSTASNNGSSSQGQTGQPSTNGTGLSLFSAITAFASSFFGGPSKANLPTQASRLAGQNNFGIGLDPEIVKTTSELDTEANKRVANAAANALRRASQPVGNRNEPNNNNNNDRRFREARKATEKEEAEAKAQADLQAHLREEAQRQKERNQKRAQEAEDELQMKVASAPLSKKVSKNTDPNDPVWKEYGLTKEQWLTFQQAHQLIEQDQKRLAPAQQLGEIVGLKHPAVPTGEQKFLQKYEPLTHPTIEAGSDKAFISITGVSRQAYFQKAMQDLNVRQAGKELANRATHRRPYFTILQAGRRKLKQKTRKHRKVHKKHSSRKQ